MWVQKTATLAVPVGYVPAATIGNYIYIAGGSIWDGTTLQDSNGSYRYDPVADAITTIATIPRNTAETRALNSNGAAWVLGGGRVAPNPSTQVDAYAPGPNTWSMALPFALARRNFATDIDPATGRIYMAGGYAPTTATNSMEIYVPSVPCGDADAHGDAAAADGDEHAAAADSDEHAAAADGDEHAAAELQDLPAGDLLQRDHAVVPA